MRDKWRDPALERVNQEKRLPFEVKVPNAETARAIKELDQGKGRRFASSVALFKGLRL